MMRQQINLYQERFHIRRVVLPANEIYALLGLGIVLLATASIGLQVAVYKMSAVQVDLERRQQNMMADNEKLKTSAASNQVDPGLEKAVIEANRKLLARKRVLDWVKRSQSEERTLFSALLEGLGRRHINGLWLSEISIDQKGGSMQLQGNALEPDLVPVFLAALKQEKAFSGTEFRKIRIEEHNPDSGIMSFLLTTEPPESDKTNRVRS